MPARKTPTERQRRLGAELRKLREHQGLSHAAAAAKHGADRTTISNVESGRFGVSPDRVRVWCANYACTDEVYVDGLVQIARERRTPPARWWHSYRDLGSPLLLDLADMEYHAVALRSMQVTHMPGLLQHPDYIRAVFREALPPPKAGELERMLHFRLERRNVLDGPSAPQCTFLVHESAFRVHFGGREVMRTQLEYLLKQVERPNVHLRILPFTAGGFPSTAGAAYYAHGPSPRLDTVHKETPPGASFLHEEDVLAVYRAALDRVEQRALGASESLDFVHAAAQEW